MGVNKGALLFVLVLLSCVAILGLSRILSPSPERYTELYFENGSGLPDYMPLLQVEPLSTRVVLQNRTFVAYGILVLAANGSPELPPQYTDRYPAWMWYPERGPGWKYYYRTGRPGELWSETAFVRSPSAAADFVIRNREGVRVRYAYEVQAYYDDGVVVRLDDGALVLSAGEKATIPLLLTMERPFTRARIEVRLVGRSEAIHFWVRS